MRILSVALSIVLGGLYLAAVVLLVAAAESSLRPMIIVGAAVGLVVVLLCGVLLTKSMRSRIPRWQLTVGLRDIVPVVLSGRSEVAFARAAARGAAVQSSDITLTELNSRRVLVFAGGDVTVDVIDVALGPGRFPGVRLAHSTAPWCLELIPATGQREPADTQTALAEALARKLRGEPTD